MTIRKARISRAVRGRVAQAAGEQCGYCRTPQHIIGHRLTIDHIIPESRGGKAVEENLWLACLACNQFKGARVRARDPISRRHVRLFNPRQQEWKAHFIWSEDGTEVVGLTPCGRATVIALQMNRPEIVGARWLWVQVGWWPPTD
jgi:hypothetical protein